MRERLAVADDHADDVVVGGTQSATRGVDAHARQADLAPRAVRCSKASGGQLLFVRAPAHLGRRRPLFAEALDAPGVDELVHLLGPVGDLRVALAAMNDLHAELLGQVVELRAASTWCAIFSACAPLNFLSAERAVGDVQQALLGEMADQARVGPVLEHRGRARLAPTRRPCRRRFMCRQ